MNEQLEGKAYLSADVFGFVTIAQDDMGIRQRLEHWPSPWILYAPWYTHPITTTPAFTGLKCEQHPYEAVSNAMG